MKKQPSARAKPQIMGLGLRDESNSKNKKVLNDFIKYCEANPGLRFWQALRNWSGSEFIYVSNVLYETNLLKDTFYFEGKGR